MRAGKTKTTDLQIRGIPVRTRDALRSKAESNGKSMSEYLIDLVDRDIGKLTLDDWLDLVAKNPRIELGRPAADLLHEIHAEEDARWDAYFASKKSVKKKRA